MGCFGGSKYAKSGFANWMIGGVGAVDDRRGSQGLMRWMEGIVHGMVIVERGVAWCVESIGWRKRDIVHEGRGSSW